MNESNIERYFCNECGHPTKHFVRKEHSVTEEDESAPVSFTQRMLIVECCGCEHLAFVKRSHCSEDVDYDHHPVTGESLVNANWDEVIYPPVTYREPPPWFDDLPDPTLKQISQEVYKSLQIESLYLATFGSRTLMDRLIVLTVGDKGSFAKGLAALLEEGKISAQERGIIEPMLQAGHAAAHRGWAPTKDQFKTILDTVEGLIYRLLVLPKLAEELEESVPRRGGDSGRKQERQFSVLAKVDAAPAALRAIFQELERVLKALGDDVSAHPQKHYLAFKRNRNFASVQIYNQKKIIRIYLNLDPDAVDLNRPGLRDVRQIGHYGTGDLEITIKSKKDIESVSDLLVESYQSS